MYNSAQVALPEVFRIIACDSWFKKVRCLPILRSCQDQYAEAKSVSLSRGTNRTYNIFIFPFNTRFMSSQTNLHEEGLSANQSHVLAGVLNHSSDLVSRVVAAHRTSGLLEDESDVTPKFFRAVNETVGKRRLFVCCDGTWVNASGTTAPLTNVARFARAIDRFGLNPDYPASPVTQVIYYSAGIGSESVLKTRVDSIYSGITGAGNYMIWLYPLRLQSGF